MERIQSAKVSCSQGISRVTTDAVHRRFLGGKKVKPTSAEKEENEDDCYYCKQCNHKIPGREDLKFHFQNVMHKPFASCVYCSKPVYEYRHKMRLEVYHICTQD